MIYAKKTENPEGDYVDVTAVRWDFDACDRIVSRRTPEQLGYTTFDTRAAALVAWGLTYDPASPLQGYAEAGPPSPLQASVSAEATPRQDGVASPLPEPTEGEG